MPCTLIPYKERGDLNVAEKMFVFLTCFELRNFFSRIISHSCLVLNGHRDNFALDCDPWLQSYHCDLIFDICAKQYVIFITSLPPHGKYIKNKKIYLHCNSVFMFLNHLGSIISKGDLYIYSSLPIGFNEAYPKIS